MSASDSADCRGQYRSTRRNFRSICRYSEESCEVTNCSFCCNSRPVLWTTASSPRPMRVVGAPSTRNTYKDNGNIDNNILSERGRRLTSDWGYSGETSIFFFKRVPLAVSRNNSVAFILHRHLFRSPLQYTIPYMPLHIGDGIPVFSQLCFWLHNNNDNKKGGGEGEKEGLCRTLPVNFDP